MEYVVPAWELPSVPVNGTDARFPVRRIYCVGRNYAAHAREMGADERDPPFFFMKPADAIVLSDGTAAYPPQTNDLHHEIELVVAIGTDGHDIAEAKALDHVFGYAVGIDLTRRDLQQQAKDKGRPWDMGKGFDQSAPITAITPAATVGHIGAGAIWLKVNDQTRQNSDVAKLIWSVPETIAYLSGLVALGPGDLIYTGTPAGVAALKPGDALHGHVDGLDELFVTIR